MADEMQVDVGGKKMWLWNVMDSKTRYIPGVAPDAQAGRQRSSCSPEGSGAGRRQAAQDHHFRQAPVLHTAGQGRAAGGRAHPVRGDTGQHQQ